MPEGPTPSKKLAAKKCTNTPMSKGSLRDSIYSQIGKFSTCLTDAEKVNKVR